MDKIKVITCNARGLNDQIKRRKLFRYLHEQKADVATNLRENKHIEGIKIGNLTNLVSLFADDLGIFMRNKDRCWQELQNEIKNFERLSGLKLNYDKTIIYRMPSALKSVASKYASKKMFWTDKPINVLGVIVCEDKDQMVKINLDPIFDKAELILQMWKTQGLTLIGKILICNTLIGSLFTYRLGILSTIPRIYIDRYNKLLRSFIWNQGTSKIAIKTLQTNKTMAD